MKVQYNSLESTVRQCRVVLHFSGRGNLTVSSSIARVRRAHRSTTTQNADNRERRSCRPMTATSSASNWRRQHKHTVQQLTISMSWQNDGLALWSYCFHSSEPGWFRIPTLHRVHLQRWLALHLWNLYPTTKSLRIELKFGLSKKPFPIVMIA